MISDSLDYLTRVDTFYQNSFDTLLNTLSLLFGGAMLVVGLIIPIIITYLQRKDYKKLIDDTNEKFDLKLLKATNNLTEQTSNAETSLSDNINLAVRTLNKQIDNNETYYAKIINKVENENEEKIGHLRDSLSIKIDSLIKSNIDTVNTKFETLQKEIKKEIQKLESEFNREISVSKGYVFYFKALSLIENESFQDAFENSLVSSKQFIISLDIEMLCVTSTMMLESYSKFKHNNLLKYWSSSLEEDLKLLLKQTKNKKPYDAHDNFYKLITSIEKDLRTYPSKTTDSQ